MSTATAFMETAFAASATAARSTAKVPANGARVVANGSEYHNEAGVVTGEGKNMMGATLVYVMLDRYVEMNATGAAAKASGDAEWADWEPFGSSCFYPYELTAETATD